MLHRYTKIWIISMLLLGICNLTFAQIVDIPDYQLKKCNEEWPKSLTTKWTDKCKGKGNVVSDSGVDNGTSEDGCIQYRLYTFTVKDKCDNVLTETTRISREYDMTDPEIQDLEDFTLEDCNAQWPKFLTTTWSDNCADGGQVQSDSGTDDGTSEDGCFQYRLYSFSVTDDCGNSATETTRVAREYDMTDPEIQDLEDFTLEDCNAQWPEFLTTTWSDNCADGGQVQSDSGIDDGTSEDGCFQYRLYSFSVTDSCGNSTTETTRVAREYDMTDPEIQDLEDFTLEDCNAQWPEFLTTTWSDNCADGGQVQSDSGTDDGTSEDGCFQYRLYSFSVTDDCGNSATETTRVAREYDMTDPEIQDLEDFTLEDCNAQWPEFLTTTWSDNCADGGQVQSDNGVDDGTSEDGCFQYRLYSFSVTDDCGNSATETTRVAREYDVTDPEIQDLEDFTLEDCNAQWPEFLTTTWSDNCADGGQVQSDNGVDDGTSEDGTIEYVLYTFEVTDHCGNASVATTRVGRLINSDDDIIRSDTELCRDYGEFNLFDLLPTGTNSNGNWILISSPFNTNVEVSSVGAIDVYSDLPYGEYIFQYVAQANQCSLIAEVTVFLLEAEPPCVEGCSGGKISTALTPNGDGVNDFFEAGISTPFRAECGIVDVQIFNRWGDKIFEAKNYRNDWDGSVHSNAIGASNKITTGTYFYIINFKQEDTEPKTITGYFYVATD